jgi:RNA-binding protein
MTDLTSTQRKHLRAMAHHLKPVVQIGQGGLTPSVLAAVGTALDAHELIKVKFLAFREHKRELAEEIGEASRAQLVGMIGNVGIFYRRHVDADRRQVDLPEG